MPYKANYGHTSHKVSQNVFKFENFLENFTKAKLGFGTFESTEY